MRRSPILVSILALVFVLLASASAAARSPMALGVASESSTDLAQIDAYRASTGAKPALWTLWSTWGDRGGRATCAKNVGTCAFPTALARGLRAKGITPFIWWQPDDPAVTDEKTDVYGRYQDIITGKHDQYIRTWAKAAKAFGKPVIVRFAHEMNGDWFAWSLGNHDNNPKRFIKAWRHIVAEFREVGARNVKFLWSPYLWGKGGYAKFYPGNAYVDYVGVTSLNWGDTRWKPLTNLLERPMGALRKITRTSSSPKGKPVILPEVGSSHIGGDKAAWIRDGYNKTYKRWPTVRAMVYFDYNTTPVYQPDWRLIMPEDGSALAAYRSVATKRIFKASIP